MDTILEKLRNIIEDNYKLISESQEYYGLTKVFTLQYANIDSSTLVVYKNGTVWAASNYSYSSTTGKVTVTGTLTAGDTLTFEYNAYEKYSTTELKGHIKSALYYIGLENYKVFKVTSGDIISPTPTEQEEDLIAILASILIKGAIRQYRTPEFTINFEDSMSIDEKIRYSLRHFKKAYGILEYIDPTEKMAEDDDDC